MNILAALRYDLQSEAMGVEKMIWKKGKVCVINTIKINSDFKLIFRILAANRT